MEARIAQIWKAMNESCVTSVEFPFVLLQYFNQIWGFSPCPPPDSDGPAIMFMVGSK